jgi:hypothetical protein
VVEFDIVLGPDWKKVGIPKILTLHAGFIEIRSTGPKSDEFVKELDSIYETGLRPKAMAHAVECEAISLKGYPPRLSAGPLDVKVFFQREDAYGAAFPYIDRSRARVYFREREPWYREGIVRTLSNVSPNEG